MRLNRTFTTALVLALSAGAAACGDHEGARTADTDGDRRNDAVDRCPNTPEGGLAGPDGCLRDEDGDHDGLASADDLCPGTVDGAKVDAVGCSADQREAGLGDGILFGEGTKVEPNVEGTKGGQSNPAAEGEALLDNPPVNGQVTNGYMALVLDRDTDRPFVFHTLATNVKQTDEGFEVHGALLLATPLGELPIANAAVTFAYGAERSQGLQTVRGDASVPFPSFGTAAGFTADDLVSASLGFDSGANLAHLGAPLHDDHHYLFCQFTAGVSVSNGPFTLALPGGADGTLVLDPFDPFVFASGSLLGLDALGKVENVGIGLSAQGLIPFHAETTRGLKDGMDDFDGALYLTGSIPLARLPFTLSGEMVLDIDPGADGRRLDEIDTAGFQLGVNGSLDLTADFLEYLSFEASVADASAEIRVTADGQRASFSGVLEPDQSWLPEELPLRADTSVNVAGLVSSDSARSYLTADGSYRLSGGKLAERLGFDLSDLAVVAAHLEIDHTGFRLVGKLDAGVKLTPELELGADATIDAKFADDPSEFSLEIQGDVKVAGVELASGHVLADEKGLHVSGQLDTGIAEVALRGEITKSGAALSGEAGVTIAVRGGKEVIETVTDGVLCGYERVTSGALCGYAIVTDGAKCGFDKITDAAVCGGTWVTDAALCGVPMVTDAALCGTHVAESLGECTASTVCDWFAWAGCETSYDCNVPSTCPDVAHPNSCEDLSKPKTCDDVTRPLSCPDLTRPLSCPDLTQPKTCPHKDVIPDFDFGKVEGKVSVTLGTNGIGGSVSGSYCPTSDSCQKVAGGRVKLGEPLEACVDVPGGLGEFCAPF